ncbi:MAG TPA: ABC transporter ATP-binding protein [Solirubrobacterales bacterium]
MSGPADAPAILTSGLSKSYGVERGIEDVDLRVERGEVFGFLGPNGAGKTTTIRLLLDLIRPSAGSATVCGFDSRESIEVRARTGYLPGELKLPDRPTAGHLLGHLDRLRGGRSKAAIDALAERLGLELDRRIGDLSKGNKEKIGVVAAFAHDPELLILDEPTSGLDPLRQQDVQDLIRERAAAGRSVFLSSHALDQVEHVARRVGIVNEGRLVAVEEIAALKARALRHVTIMFAGEPPADELQRLPGARRIVRKDDSVRIEFEGEMDGLVKELARHRVKTLSSEEPELDEIFRAFYGRDDGD